MGAAGGSVPDLGGKGAGSCFTGTEFPLKWGRLTKFWRWMGVMAEQR